MKLNQIIKKYKIRNFFDTNVLVEQGPLRIETGVDIWLIFEQQFIDYNLDKIIIKII